MTTQQFHLIKERIEMFEANGKIPHEMACDMIKDITELKDAGYIEITDDKTEDDEKNCI